MLRLCLMPVALVSLCAEAQSTHATRPTDPRAIAQVIGVSGHDQNEASCSRSVSPLATVGARGVLSCLPAASTVLRDSIARPLSRRGLHHLSCPDSVQHPREGRTHWLSVWQGPAYNILRYHVRADSDTLQLTIQASPGLGERCFTLACTIAPASARLTNAAPDRRAIECTLRALHLSRPQPHRALGSNQASEPPQV